MASRNKPNDPTVSLFKIIFISLLPGVTFGYLMFLFFEWFILEHSIGIHTLNLYYAILSACIFYLLSVYIGVVFGRSLYRRTSSKSVKRFKEFTDKLHNQETDQSIYPGLYDYLHNLFRKSKINIYYKNVDNPSKTKWVNYPDKNLPICSMNAKTCPVLAQGKECFVNDIETDITCAYQLPFYTKGSYMCLKVAVNKEPHGVVQLYHPEKNYFDQDTVTDIKSYINVLEPIIQGKTQLKDLNTEVFTDKLTGAKNRTYLDQEIDNLIKISDTKGDPFSLIMIDLDFFKKINDTYGHPAGDCILVEFSKIVLGCIRNNDMLARYGGEEFIILLPNSNLAYATSIAERIRSTVASSRMPMFEGTNLPNITCSLGISSYPGYADNKTNLITTADRALYTAKKNGRNKTVAFDPYKSEDNE
jgi:diguanylate cyclase (GGDEF)-like protein